MTNKSDLYAERDGIKVKTGRGRGTTNCKIYCIPCSICGRIIEKTIYNGDKEYQCDFCKKGIKAKKRQLEQTELDKVKTRKEQQFDKAVERIKKQVKNFKIYEDSIKICRTRAEKFGSIPEVMVGIELVRLGYSVIPQQSINKYKVDFLLKKEKIVIEVDGAIYHRNELQSDREATIQLVLGMDWKIIHIPAELISKDIQKLSEVIRKCCNTGERNI